MEGKQVSKSYKNIKNTSFSQEGLGDKRINTEYFLRC